MDIDLEAKNLLVAANALLEAYDDGKPLFPRMVELKRTANALSGRMCRVIKQEQELL